MNNRYTPLHVHSEYSLLDGLSKCTDIAERVEQIGSTACVISDHGSISGAVDFSQEMKEKKFKPLLGCEMYVCMNGPVTQKDKENRALSHQVVIAKNKEGWQDLLNLITLSNKREHSYYKPRVDLDIFAAIAQSGNLVSFSGHLGSTLTNTIMPNDTLDPDWLNKGVHMAYRLQDIFGVDNFFIEIQVIDSRCNPKAAVAAGALRDIAEKTGIPCVATPDAHYCTSEDAEDQRILLCNCFNKTIGQVRREMKQGTASKVLGTFFRSDQYHIPTYEEMARYNTEIELANTNVIADMCEDYSILRPPDPPEFVCPSGLSPNEFLRKLCRDGWAEKMSHIEKGTEEFKTYGSRVNEELEIFTSIGLSSYFLIVNDILDFVRRRGYIVGPGRGSAAGCMVSHLLGITSIDPIPFGLILERFYNSGRNTPGNISWPDIDFDIPKASREETVEYIRTKYGEDNVAQIITFQTLKGKAALTRVMMARGNVAHAERKAITSCLIDESKVADELKGIKEEYGFSSSILWALENKAKALKDWCYIGKEGKLEGRLAKIFEQAIRLEHTRIISGKHAAGVVVSKTPISDSCPMVLNKDGTHMLAGFEGPRCEEVGLLKLDCLALKGLDKVMDTVTILAGED